MYGSIAGNLAGTAYYLYFQLIGMTFVFLQFRREKPLSKLLLGSVVGSLLLTWLPIPFAFFCGFTPLAHMLAMAAAPAIPAAAAWLYRLRQPFLDSLHGFLASLKVHLPFGMLLILFLAFWCYLLHTHTILSGSDNAMYTGQSTYGDMNMHLGFITSLAKQGHFPPDYSIMPGVKLSYPFLSDSISASLYVLGASLRLAYILPMIFAMGQIVTAAYLFANTIMRSRDRASGSSGKFLVLLLFFCNGGLVFSYFLDWSKEGGYRFSDIFTGFYTTPTNLTGHNIRWVNVVADMFLPQRATLFGYAVLLPALWLLYRAVFQNRREYYPLAGMLVAALPMIHTHSFLIAGVVSAAWLLLWLVRRNPSRKLSARARSWQERFLRHGWALLLLIFTLLMCLLQYMDQRQLLTGNGLMLICILPFAMLTLWGICLLFSHVRQHGWKCLLVCWGAYLTCILLFALPQLLFWTFGQVAEGGFVRGHFNWANQGDPYPWFYLKNIGVALLPILGGFCACGKKRAPLFFPALLLWWLSELVVFTPNTYDNNKLLYGAYFLLCLGAADYCAALYERQKKFPGYGIFAALFFFLVSFSGILTLGREAVSRYQLYSPEQVALAEYVENHTEADAVFLTDTRHNNEIASLAGRNVVCGADTFLYFHGLDTSRRKTDLALMYNAPLEHMDLFDKYRVTYVVVSDFERRSYSIDTNAFHSHFKEVLSIGDITLYQVNVP